MNMDKVEIKTTEHPLSSTLLMDLYGSKWVRCEDMLPSNNDDVLIVAVDNGDTEIRIGFCNNDCWYSYTDNDKLAKVTHWMPLPDLPKD